MNLREAEKKIYSQNGEDGVLRAIFDVLGDGNKTFVEIGSGRESTWVNRDFAGNSGQNNTRALFRSGWGGKWFDMLGKGVVVKVKITAENVLSTMAANGVPAEPDLLSLDIDGNDYWVLREFLKVHKPRVMVCEYNASRDPEDNSVISYDPGFQWNGTDYFGASLLALETLAREHGILREQRGERLLCADRARREIRGLPSISSRCHRPVPAARLQDGRKQDRGAPP